MKYALIAWMVVSATIILAQDVQQILQEAGLSHAQVGIHLQGLEDNDELINYHADNLLIPASTQKLLVGLTALRKLGPDYRFQTKIAYTGGILSDGTLTGDLLIIGSHDPTLGSTRIDPTADLHHVLDQIKTVVSDGITCIDGYIICVSPSALDYNPERYWLYEDLGNYYGSPSRGINIMENSFDIYLKRRPEIGASCAIARIHPEDIGMQVTSQVGIGPSGFGDQAYVLGAPEDERVSVVGTIPPGSTDYKIRGSLPNPPLFLAKKVQQSLSGLGISSQGYKVTTRTPSDYKVITAFASPTLHEIVRVIHQKSNNLYAESVYHAMGLPDLKQGEGHIMKDACGLSPLNRISPRQMTSFLSADRVPSLSLLKSLPASGASGTMRHLLTQQPYHGRVYAKSGSMSTVLCYAGYMDTDAGWRAFSIMINGFDQEIKTVKPVAEAIMKMLFDFRS